MHRFVQRRGYQQVIPRVKCHVSNGLGVIAVVEETLVVAEVPELGGGVVGGVGGFRAVSTIVRVSVLWDRAVWRSEACIGNVWCALGVGCGGVMEV